MRVIKKAIMDQIVSFVNEYYRINGRSPSITEIAKEVVAGKWGNGSERKAKLEKAGYNYGDIQKIVNNLLR